MINLDMIARAYGGTVTGASVHIPTPGHSAKDRGTKITPDPKAPDGVLVHSFNGGDPLEIKDILRRDGFLPQRESSKSTHEPRPLFTVRSEGVVLADTGWESRLRWPYHDAQGNHIYTKVRTNKPDGTKSYRYEQADGTLGKGTHPHLLYRLPDLLENDALVIMAEGERCADKLSAWGFVATSSKDAEKADLSALAGRRIVILPDNDDPGRSCADAVFSALKQTGAWPAILALPNLPPKGDIVDWPGSRDDLNDLIANLDWPREAGALECRSYSWQDPQRLPRRRWLLGRWLQRGEVTGIIAPGGTGKSSLLGLMALSLASGEDLLGLGLPEGYQGVWLHNLEDSLTEMERQIAALTLRHNIRREQCGERLYINSGLEQPLLAARDVRGAAEMDEELFEHIEHLIQKHGIGLLIIDPLVSTSHLSENDNSLTDRLVKRWKKVAHRGNCAVVLAHHTPKLAGREVTAEDGRGAVAFRDACRVVLTLNKMSAEEAGSCGIGLDERKRWLRVDTGKINRAPSEDSVWLRFEGQRLGNDDEHGQGDTIGVLVAGSRPDAFDGISNHDLHKVQQAIRADDRWKMSDQADNWVGILVGEILGLEARGKDKARVKSILKTWLDAGVLKTVERKENYKMRKFVTVGREVPFSELGGLPPPRK